MYFSTQWRFRSRLKWFVVMLQDTESALPGAPLQVKQLPQLRFTLTSIYGSPGGTGSLHYEAGLVGQPPVFRLNTVTSS